jgi:hypothetical protein
VAAGHGELGEDPAHVVLQRLDRHLEASSSVLPRMLNLPKMADQPKKTPFRRPDNEGGPSWTALQRGPHCRFGGRAGEPYASPPCPPIVTDSPSAVYGGSPPYTDCSTLRVPGLPAAPRSDWRPRRPCG